MAVTSRIIDTCSTVSPFNLIIVKGDEIVRPYDRHSIETVTLRKYVTKYKNMLKWILEFLMKFENRVIKIGLDNSILITKISQFTVFTLILYAVGGPL